MVRQVVHRPSRELKEMVLKSLEQGGTELKLKLEELTRKDVDVVVQTCAEYILEVVSGNRQDPITHEFVRPHGGSRHGTVDQNALDVAESEITELSELVKTQLWDLLAGRALLPDICETVDRRNVDLREAIKEANPTRSNFATGLATKVKRLVDRCRARIKFDGEVVVVKEEIEFEEYYVDEVSEESESEATVDTVAALIELFAEDAETTNEEVVETYLLPNIAWFLNKMLAPYLKFINEKNIPNLNWVERQTYSFYVKPLELIVSVYENMRDFLYREYDDLSYEKIVERFGQEIADLKAGCELHYKALKRERIDVGLPFHSVTKLIEQFVDVLGNLEEGDFVKARNEAECKMRDPDEILISQILITQQFLQEGDVDGLAQKFDRLWEIEPMLAYRIGLRGCKIKGKGTSRDRRKSEGAIARMNNSFFAGKPVLNRENIRFEIEAVEKKLLEIGRGQQILIVALYEAYKMGFAGILFEAFSGWSNEEERLIRDPGAMDAIMSFYKRFSALLFDELRKVVGPEVLRIDRQPRFERLVEYDRLIDQLGGGRAELALSRNVLVAVGEDGIVRDMRKHPMFRSEISEEKLTPENLSAAVGKIYKEYVKDINVAVELNETGSQIERDEDLQREDIGRTMMKLPIPSTIENMSSEELAYLDATLDVHMVSGFEAAEIPTVVSELVSDLNREFRGGLKIWNEEIIGVVVNAAYQKLVERSVDAAEASSGIFSDLEMDFDQEVLNRLSVLRNWCDELKNSEQWPSKGVGAWFEDLLMKIEDVGILRTIPYEKVQKILDFLEYLKQSARIPAAGSSGNVSFSMSEGAAEALFDLAGGEVGGRRPPEVEMAASIAERLKSEVDLAEKELMEFGVAEEESLKLMEDLDRLKKTIDELELRKMEYSEEKNLLEKKVTDLLAKLSALFITSSSEADVVNARAIEAREQLKTLNLKIEAVDEDLGRLKNEHQECDTKLALKLGELEKRKGIDARLEAARMRSKEYLAKVAALNAEYN